MDNAENVQEKRLAEEASKRRAMRTVLDREEKMQLAMHLWFESGRTDLVFWAQLLQLADIIPPTDHSDEPIGRCKGLR